MIFESERLLLRPTNIEDAAFIVDLLNTPKWLEYIGDRNVKTIEDAKEYIKAKMLPQFERLGYSNFTIITKDTDLKVGCCGLYDRPGISGVDLGFALLPEHEGNGYGLESARTILNIAAQLWSITEVKAITLPANLASQQLLTKLGFGFISHISLNQETLMLFEKQLVEKTLD